MGFNEVDGGVCSVDGVLDDQVAALHQAAERHPEIDLERVAIRGWSFGGFLAALAVLRRPDVFHAAIAGAPVTEWRLYDTHYTERYLGDPANRADAYDASSLLPLAADLRPEAMITIADDPWAEIIRVAERYRPDWDRFNLWGLRGKNLEPVFRAYSLANPPSEPTRLCFTIRIATPPPGSKNLPPGTGSTFVVKLPRLPIPDDLQ